MTEAATVQGVEQAPIDPEIAAANAPDPEAGSVETLEAKPPAERKETERERVIREMAERRQAQLTAGEDEYRSEVAAQGQDQGTELEQADPHAGMVQIKVDGIEKWVPEADVLEHGKRALQKESAADRRMEEAARLRADAERRAQEVNALAAQLQRQKEQDQGKQLSKQDAADLKAVAADVYSKIMSGDEDAAIEAMAGMMGRSNATPDVGAMIEAAKKVAREEVQAEKRAQEAAEATKRYEKSKGEFAEKYPAINKDPMLYRLADAETMKVMADHPEWDASRDVDKILMEAGKRVMDWKGSNPQASKTDLKRNMRQIRGGDQRIPGTPEKRPLTASEIIAQQRAARGLPNY